MLAAYFLNTVVSPQKISIGVSELNFLQLMSHSIVLRIVRPSTTPTTVT
jgi:hypothetical protein